MATSVDVHVRICGQEIIKYDLEIKALVQVRTENVCLPIDVVSLMSVSVLFRRSVCACFTQQVWKFDKQMKLTLPLLGNS